MFAATKKFSSHYQPNQQPNCQPGDQPRPRLSGANQIDLNALSQRIGQGYQLVAGDLPASSAILEGQFSIARLREGFFLHCTNITHHHDMTARFPLLKEGIKVLLKLEGNAEVSFGTTPIHLDAGQGATASPCGAIVTLSQPESFERRCRANTTERMVVITLTPAWFAAASLDIGRFQPHLSIRPWQPSPRAIVIAEQLVRPPAFEGSMHTIYQESRALELVAEALGEAQPGLPPNSQPASSGLHPAEYQRICRLQELLDSGEADQLDMSRIAQHIGCNPSTLQQQFRLVFGQTIFDYLRERRLQRAAGALQRDGVSVARAAEIAGYSSQANFSTAFRRHFGIAPKHLRQKL